MTVRGVPEGPMFTVAIRLEEFDTVGWVCVHTLGDRGACGGIRLVPDVTQSEVEALAAGMTRKYAFLGCTLGGAKGGLRVSPDWSPQQRAAALRQFGRQIGPLIDKGLYTPWTDMNCGDDDVAEVYAGTGKSFRSSCHRSAIYTAWSTFEVLRATAEYLAIPPNRCRVAIEGMGSVGSELSKRVDEWGGIVTAASTRLGAVAAAAGLDVPALCRRREAVGDAFVHEPGPYEQMDAEALFAAETDILVPCARCGSVSGDRAGDLSCRAIVPAANLPYADGALDALVARSILALPDFVTNTGGILGSGLASLGATDPDIRQLLGDTYSPLVGRLLRKSAARRIPCVRLALDEIFGDYERIVESSLHPPKRPRGLRKLLGRLRRSPSRRTRLAKRVAQVRDLFAGRFVD